MDYKQVLAQARADMGPYCKACDICNGRACRNSIPGPGAKGTGDGAMRNYDAWQQIRVNMDSFTKFADYFFDCFIMDLKVLDKIQNSLESVKDTKNQIVSIVNKLDKMLETTDKQLACAQRDKNEIILNADI